MKLTFLILFLCVNLTINAQNYSDYLEGTLIVNKDTTKIEQIFIHSRKKSVSIKIKGCDFNYLINTKFTNILEFTKEYIIFEENIKMIIKDKKVAIIK